MGAISAAVAVVGFTWHAKPSTSRRTLLALRLRGSTGGSSAGLRPESNMSSMILISTQLSKKEPSLQPYTKSFTCM